MGPIHDYFAASTDAEAAATITQDGGPGSAEPGSGERIFDTVAVSGIDPIIQLGMLEELMTGRSFDDVMADPRTGNSVAMTQDGERMVLTLNDNLHAALARATANQLAAVTGPWSQAEVAGGTAGAPELSAFLHDLAALAARSKKRDERLYCWVSL